MNQTRHILAIETSNPSATQTEGESGTVFGPGVALGAITSDGGHDLLDEEALREKTRHDDDLMPAIDRLCRRNAVTPGMIDRVAVSVGPGGYTGLRIAVSVARMIALVNGAKVIPVESWRVAAWRVPIEAAPAVVCLASKHDTAFGAILPSSGTASEWWDRTRPSLMPLMPASEFERVASAMDRGEAWITAGGELGVIGADAIRVLRPATIIADQHLPPSFRAAAADVGVRIVPPTFAAADVLLIASRRQAIEPDALLPRYPREPEAIALWRTRTGHRIP